MEMELWKKIGFRCERGKSPLKYVVSVKLLSEGISTFHIPKKIVYLSVVEKVFHNLTYVHIRFLPYKNPIFFQLDTIRQQTQRHLSQTRQLVYDMIPETTENKGISKRALLPFMLCL
jgi:hypothetical protein